MDVVYPLGRGSNWSNNELKYSILSVQKHLKGFRNIYVVGFNPNINKNYIHIPCEDSTYKNTNIRNKVLAACKIRSISDDFIFMNDDVFFCKDIHVNDVPVTYVGELEHRKEIMRCASYKQVLRNTYDVLSSRGLPTKDFDGHIPIPYNKKLFIETTSQYSWKILHGYAVKTIHYNTLKVEGILQKDCKIIKPERDIRALIDGRWCFSLGDSGLTSAMKLFLREFIL